LIGPSLGLCGGRGLTGGAGLWGGCLTGTYKKIKKKNITIK
jgi:hypothetical protein